MRQIYTVATRIRMYSALYTGQTTVHPYIVYSST